MRGEDPRDAIYPGRVGGGVRAMAVLFRCLLCPPSSFSRPGARRRRADIPPKAYGAFFRFFLVCLSYREANCSLDCEEA